MKKYLILFITAALFFCLAACAVTENACAHSFVPQTQISSTCIEEGSVIFVCSVCGEYRTTVLPKVSHKYDLGQITKEATCIQEGEKIYSCTVCDDSYTKPIDRTIHNYDNGKVTSPASCTQEGTKTVTCETCGDTKTETISKTGHNYESRVSKKATCTETGVKTYTCSDCGDNKTESITKAAHKYGNAKVTTAATCTKTGVKTFTCSDCKDSYTEKIAKTGHSYKGKVTTAATCKAAGVKTYTCSGCGKSYTESIAKKSQHNYVSGCCSWCGKKDPNYVHTYSAGEKWAVPGKFEFTIDSVVRHELCDDYYNENHNEIGAQTAVIITYTYKNLGSDKLSISKYDFEVYDPKGTEGDYRSFPIWCEHGSSAQNCITGGSCTAKLPVALVNSGNSVTIYMDVDGQTATFKIDVTGSGNNGGSSNSGSTQNLWTYSDASKLDNYVKYAVNALENAKNSYDNGTVYYGVAASYCRSASGYIKSAIDLLESKAELKFTDGTTMLEEFEEAYEVISGLDGITITYDNAAQYKSLIGTTSYTGAVKASLLRILTTKLLAEF